MTAQRFSALILIAAACRLTPAMAQPQADVSLFEAISFNRLEVVESFLARGGDPNAVVPNPDTATRTEPLLSVAVRGSREDIFLALLRAGASMETADLGIQSLISVGMDRALASVLADAESTDLMALERALSWAVRLGHYDSVEVLLDHIRERDLPVRELTQGTVASAIGDDDIARLLIGNGAPVDGAALRAAARWSSPGMLRYLLQLGADPVERYFRSSSGVPLPEDGFTAIDYTWEHYVDGNPSQKRVAAFKLFDLLALGAVSEKVDTSVAVDGRELLSQMTSPAEKLKAAAEWGFYDIVSEILSRPNPLESTALTDAATAAL